MLDTQDILVLRELLLEQERKLLVAMKENGENIENELGKEIRTDIETSANNLRQELKGDIHASANGLRKEFTSAIKQSADDTKREIRDEMHALLTATESRLKNEMGIMEKRIILGVGEFISTAIIPQLDELYRDVARIKNHLQMA